MTTPLERLGPVVRRANETAIDAAVRAASLRRGAVKRSAPRGLVGALIVAASLAVFALLRSSTPPAVTLDGVGLSAERTSVEGAHTLSFSARRVAQLHEGRLQLATAEGNVVRLVLDEGRLELQAPTSAGFVLTAGAWEVNVSSTRVSAAWAPATRRLEVTVLEGEAEVRGPDVPPRRLGAGERFVDEPHGTAPSPAVTPPAALEAPPPSPETPPAPKRQPSRSAPLGPTTASPSWLEALKQGAFAQAVLEADRAGFARLAASEPADRLLLLADAYRFQQRTDEARTLYLAARSRSTFPETKALAAFQLGVSSDDAGEAADWFEKAYAEAPSGPLAAQALGRLLEVRSRSQQPGAAETARLYLSRWPEGPYAPLARLLTK